MPQLSPGPAEGCKKRQAILNRQRIVRVEIGQPCVWRLVMGAKGEEGVKEGGVDFCRTVSAANFWIRGAGLPTVKRQECFERGRRAVKRGSGVVRLDEAISCTSQL
jgi:hypothetical protein